MRSAPPPPLQEDRSQRRQAHVRSPAILTVVRDVTTLPPSFKDRSLFGHALPLFQEVERSTFTSKHDLRGSPLAIDYAEIKNLRAFPPPIVLRTDTQQYVRTFVLGTALATLPEHTSRRTILDRS